MPTQTPTRTPTPTGLPPVFSDEFESGNLAAWTTNSGLTVESSIVHSGSFAAQGNTTTGDTYAKKLLPSTYTDGYSRIYFNLVSYSSFIPAYSAGMNRALLMIY